MRVVLVDDHTLFVEALRSLLELNGTTVVGTAGDGLAGVQRVRELQPDLVLMDIHMPRCNGIEATRLIKAEFPQVKVVILTMSENDEDLFNAIKSGASGYITKDTAPRTFLDLLAGLVRGEAALTNKTATRLLGEFARGEKGAPPDGVKHGKGHGAYAELSPRQIEVLRMTAEGYTYKEIATALSISERTVNYHMGEILGKLRLQNRAQAIAYATSAGLIEEKH